MEENRRIMFRFKKREIMLILASLNLVKDFFETSALEYLAEDDVDSAEAARDIFSEITSLSERISNRFDFVGGQV